MKHLFTIEGMAHSVMIAFAAASLSNVAQFFLSSGHTAPTAWALGVALGGVLVACSIMLTSVDRQANRQEFKLLVIAATAAALVSGGIQSAEYAKHLPMWAAVLLGVSLPLLGEVLLALAVAGFIRARAGEEFRNVGALVESSVVAILKDSVATMDRSAIEKHVERSINGLARQAVTSVTARAGMYYADQTPTEAPGAPNESAPAECTVSPKTNDLGALKAQADAARANGKAQAIERAFEFFSENPHASLSEAGEAIGRSKSTVKSYLDELQAAGRVHVNGSVQVI